MKKMRLIVLLILISIFVTACRTEYDDEGFFVIYIPATMDSAQHETLFVDYLNWIIQDAGQPIRFRRYVYNEWQVRNILNRMSPNSAIVVPKHEAIVFYNEGIIGNFYTEASIYAPTYMEKVQHLLTHESMFHIPTEIIYEPLAPAALIRTDQYNSWMFEVGLPIDNIETVEKLLVWIQERGWYTVPAVYISNLSYWNFNFLPLEIWMDGYTSLAGMIKRYFNQPLMLWQNDETGVIRPFYNITSATDALLTPLYWRDRELLNFWDGTYLSHRYPVILMNSVHRFHLMVNEGLYRKRFIAPATKSRVRFTWHGGAVALPDADVGPLFDFLEWLTIPENHELLVFGIENTDFSRHRRDDYIMYVYTEYSVWEGRWFFGNDTMWSESVRLTTVFADNVDERANMQSPQFPFDDCEIRSLAVELAGSTAYINAMHSMTYHLSNLYSQIHNSHVTIDEARDYITEAFDRIRNIDGIDEVERLIRAMQ